MALAKCPCGSGLCVEALFDAKGIFCTYVCPKCVKEKKAKFRPEIFIDFSYEADEMIDPDE